MLSQGLLTVGAGDSGPILLLSAVTAEVANGVAVHAGDGRGVLKSEEFSNRRALSTGYSADSL